MPNKKLLAASAIFGALYLATQPWQPYPGSFAVKGLSIGLLALLAFPRVPNLGIALTLSTLGDVLLDLNPEGYFVYGLGSFLIAHMVYVVFFVRNRPRPFTASPGKIAAAALVLLYSAGISAWLFPSLGDLQLPVAIYMCAITAMAIAAILSRFPAKWVATGAILFVASDSLLAINKFKTPVPYRDVLVWSTYYLAQFAITKGVLED